MFQEDYEAIEQGLRTAELEEGVNTESAGPIAPPAEAFVERRKAFRPSRPTSLSSAGLNPSRIEGLILKTVQFVGVASGRAVASYLGLPFALLQDELIRLQKQKLLTYANVAEMGDYEYTPTEAGRNRAREYTEECSYLGVAPVSYEDYVASVNAQTIANERPLEADLRRAFSDLLIADEMFNILGPAINSGRGMFLYGAPGNGKTSIAERITRCYGRSVWIPQVLDLGGMIVKLFDPSVHEPIVPESDSRPRRGDVDGRWIEIRRPTVVVGGELTMDRLEISYDPISRISEASLQMKSNNGTLLIDDFGRQRMQPVELLNRMIIPLEKRYDYLTLSNGKNIRIPFDQLTLFSTNLEPKHLVDEAFLRRIPYKIQVTDPDEGSFRKLLWLLAEKLGFEEVQSDPIDYLIETHYRPEGRSFRSCQPRDLMLQARSYCLYNDRPLRLTREVIDFAVKCYFTKM
ncbi:AAA family ATPase [Tundrisphaera lichenicola]|uniref:AAA family ATPase n=1 Tax=Tundrisphaera lichenicola TaxID=2029860 RepID=UPI003EBD97B8